MSHALKGPQGQPFNAWVAGMGLTGMILETVLLTLMHHYAPEQDALMFAMVFFIIGTDRFLILSLWRSMRNDT